MTTTCDAPGKILDWDSHFFGFTIGKVIADKLTVESAGQIDAWAQAANVKCLYFLASLADYETAHVAAHYGYTLVDVRVKKTYNVLTAPAGFPATPHEIRAVRSEDMPQLNDLVSSISWDTRFAFDPQFPRDKVQQLYVLFLERCISANSALVLVFEQDGEITGVSAGAFSAEKKAGSLELTAVSEKHTGKEYGASLTRAVMKKLAETGASHITMVTQTRNCASLALHEKCGFITASVDAWYHKWYC